MTESIKVSVVYHSGFGHTKVIAEAIARGAESTGSHASLIRVNPQGEIEAKEWQTLQESHAIIFGAPTYMGSVSGPFKMFMDATSKPWFSQAWKDKIAGGFTNSQGLSGDKLSTLQQLVVLAAQHSMIWVSHGQLTPPSETPHQRDPNSVNRVSSYIGVMAQSENVSSEQSPPSGDIKTAELYGERIADAAHRWNKA